MGAMRIKWLGHSCFLITAESGSSLLTDPYDSKAYPGRLLYTPLEEMNGISPEIVTVSHGHSDHANVKAIKGSPLVLATPEPREHAGFRVRGVPVFHDSKKGRKRGGNIVFLIEAGGITVCHMGDLGHELSPEQTVAIGAIQVLLIPVGGFYTIDAAEATRVREQLSPPVTLPMHYRNDKCLFEITGVEDFTAGKANVEVPGASEIELKKENLPDSPKIIVLEHAN